MRGAGAAYALAMACCPYCGKRATMKIVSSPDTVCFDHAMEFWTGPLVFAQDRAELCITHDQLCSCPACREIGGLSVRARAIAAAGPPPPLRERVRLRRAS
jgi:hypothetical protein